MIYLFNSAFYDKYTVNVLNTLHLPFGVENTYRYTSETSRNFVENSLVNSPPDNDDVMIIFIDRYSDGEFKYYPLRKGKLISVKKEEGKVFFKIQLLEYYAVNDIEKFNIAFSKEFAGRVPTISPDKDPGKDGQGFFAFTGRDVSNDYPCIENPWTINVERLSNLKAFKDKFIAFTKVEILDTNNKIIQNKKYRRFFIFKNQRSNKIELKTQRLYRIKLHYYFSEQEKNKDSFADIELVEKSSSFSVFNSTQSIRNRKDQFIFEIFINQDSYKKYEEILFKITSCSCDENRQKFISDSPIEVFISNSKFLWLEIGIYTLLIGLCRYILDIEPENVISKLSANSNTIGLHQQLFLHFVQILHKYNNISLIIINLISSFLTFFTFLRFRKKVI